MVVGSSPGVRCNRDRQTSPRKRRRGGAELVLRSLSVGTPTWGVIAARPIIALRTVVWLEPPAEKASSWRRIVALSGSKPRSPFLPLASTNRLWDGCGLSQSFGERPFDVLPRLHAAMDMARGAEPSGLCRLHGHGRSLAEGAVEDQTLTG